MSPGILLAPDINYHLFIAYNASLIVSILFAIDSKKDNQLSV